MEEEGLQYCGEREREIEAKHHAFSMETWCTMFFSFKVVTKTKHGSRSTPRCAPWTGAGSYHELPNLDPKSPRSCLSLCALPGIRKEALRDHETDLSTRRPCCSLRVQPQPRVPGEEFYAQVTGGASEEAEEEEEECLLLAAAAAGCRLC